MPDLDPERAIIGAAIRTPDAMDDVTLIPDDFGNIRLGTLWRLFLDMREKGEPVDRTTFHVALGRLSENERRFFDQGALFELYQEAPVAGSVGYYADLVYEAAAMRRLHVFGTRVLQLATGSGMRSAEAIEIARTELDANHRETASVAIVSERIRGTLDDLNSRPARAIPTPWPSINKKIGGWRPGALYVVGARPGVGKTILGVEAAIGLAKHGLVAFNSLEMPEEELHGRLIANIAQVKIDRLDNRTLRSEDWQRIRAAEARLMLDISIDDRGTVTTTDVRSHARSLSRRGPVSAVIVDYLQLMSSDPGDRRPRHEVVAAHSRNLKLLAKELDCPVIALSQLNRESTKRADGRPQLSDLRESGAVEQDSDVILLMHEDTVDETDLTILVAKNRHGARGEVQLIRQGWFSALSEHAWDES